MHGMKFGKALLISFIVIVILVVIIVGINAAGLMVTWPILFCGYYFCNPGNMDLNRVPGLAIWGAVGLAAGLFEPYLGAAFGELEALLGLLVAAMVVIALGMTGGLPWAESHFMLLMLTVATGGTHLMTVQDMPQIWISYAVGILIMALIGLTKNAIVARGKKKAAVAEGESQ